MTPMPAPREHQKLEARIGSLALKHGVQPEHLPAALDEFRKHLAGADPDDLQALSTDEDALDLHAANYMAGWAEAAAPKKEEKPPKRTKERMLDTSGAKDWAHSEAGVSNADIAKRTGLAWK